MTPLSRRFRRLPIARRRELASLARRAVTCARCAVDAPWPATSAGLARLAARHGAAFLDQVPPDKKTRPPLP